MDSGITFDELLSRPRQLGLPLCDVSLYDDEAAVVEYVWQHYQHLLTPAEARAGLYLRGMTRAVAIESKGVQFADWLDETFGAVTEQQISQALADGWDALRIRTTQRLLTERAEEIFVNRCPSCRRIVQSPLAKQCHWCKHNWRQKTPT